MNSEEILLDLRDCRDCACMNLRKAARAVTQYYDRVLQPVGLRGTQFTILAAVAAAGSVPISRLAKSLVMDRTTLTRNLRPLQARGLVRIQRGQDQRTRLLTLEPPGFDLLKKALPYWREAQQNFTTGLGLEHFHTYLATLSRLVNLSTTNPG